MPRYIGLMSGTSLDGLDAVVLDCADGTPGEPLTLALLGHLHRPFAPDLRTNLLDLNRRGGTDELHRAALAANRFAMHAASVVQALLASAGVPAGSVRAIGSHGQTVRHQPGPHGTVPGYTLQLDNPALLAEQTGIDVVADFRRHDVAAGGQGAPLAPAFHAALFARAGQDTAVLNLGGFANLTLLSADGRVCGFDCGPANCWLDAWWERHHGSPYDADGRWAASGRADPALLQQLGRHPFFALPPPKSTGRDDFHLAGLDAELLKTGRAIAPADVQATLATLTADIVAGDLLRHAPATRALWVGGGGAHNAHLMQLLRERLPGLSVDTTAALGLQPTQVEAAAFAWLAHRHLERQPGNRPDVTGARGPRVLGACYPATR